jgi:SAM-dependent methyltransferase
MFNRSKEKIYRYFHPDLPWISPQANDFLSRYLAPDFDGIEYGSGRSTLYFSKKVHSLVSIEHDPFWYTKISEQLKKNNITNVEYHLFPRENENQPELEKYVQYAGNLNADSLDFALIDGIYRDYCTKKILPVLRPGGILIIDNVNRYIPGKTCSPYSIGDNHPPLTQLWAELNQIIMTWRCLWSSNGVSDTAIYFKPDPKGSNFYGKRSSVL